MRGRSCGSGKLGNKLNHRPFNYELTLPAAAVAAVQLHLQLLLQSVDRLRLHLPLAEPHPPLPQLPLHHPSSP